MTKHLPLAVYEQDYAKSLQKQIIRYFDTGNAVFDEIQEVNLYHLTDFTRLVLTECRKIAPSQTIPYSALAKRIRKPLAARAVGTALAKNPLPLIIPCHRIIKKTGSPGRFSAGGTSVKNRLLNLERNS